MKLLWTAGMLGGLLLAGSACAQSPGPAAPVLVKIDAGVDAAKLPKSRTFPHLNPPPLPPVAQFNQLLRASPEDRTNQLAGKSVAARGVILRALSQFDALTGVEREQRVLQLRVAQLRFFLRPLLRASPESRPTLLQSIPADDRILVESRLAAWDQLPESVRVEVCESDDALQRFVRQASASPADGGGGTNSPSLALPLEVQQSWDRWQSLAPSERLRREANFRLFFDLTVDEQIRAIGGLPSAERQRMEYALTKFNQLPPERRELCVKNFDRLARLPQSEQTAFLRNAAKWELMTQSERDAWRRLVVSVPPPPMPPVPASVAGGGKGNR